ncbi:MAG TPA: PilZ domain-containing protein [Polyangia bacterium]|jgi:hypothetical protein|nr:PilZ domain-containing protein [Polyangia bacterium]
MLTKRNWRPDLGEKREKQRVSADFYAVELAQGARYLRKVSNVSSDGLLIESPLGDERPGQTVDLELPRREGERPLRVQGLVVYVKEDGRVGVRVTSAPLPVSALGGREAL